MDIETITLHLEQFVTTVEGWGSVLSGLSEFFGNVTGVLDGVTGEEGEKFTNSSELFEGSSLFDGSSANGAVDAEEKLVESGNHPEDTE